jgi:hypothetical protein
LRFSPHPNGWAADVKMQQGLNHYSAIAALLYAIAAGGATLPKE